MDISRIQDIYDLLNQGMPLSEKRTFIHPKTNNRARKMSLGRIWFNLLLPDKIKLIDEPVTKSKLDDIIKEIIKNYPPDEASDIVSKITEESFVLATLKPSSFNIDGLIIPKELEEAKEEFRKKAKDLSPSEFKKESDKLVQKFIDYLNSQNLTIQNVLLGGVKGNPLDDWKTLLISKGYVYDIKGNLLGPITNGLEDGYSKEDFYNSAAEGRDLFYKKAIATEKPGYLARKITMANVNVVIDDSKDDCGTKKYLILSVDNDLAKRLNDRYYYNEDSGKIEKINIDKIVGKAIKLRSPIYCKAKNGICPICYGDHWKNLETKEIGILAGGAFNGVGINTMMKLKHAGSQININEVDFPAILQKFNLLTSFSSFFEIEKTKIIAKKLIRIVIDSSDYSESDLIDAGDYLILPGIIDFQTDDGSTYTFPFQFQIKLYKPENYELDEKIYTLEYAPGEIITNTENYEKKVDPAVMDRILEGLTRYITTPEILLDVLANLITGIDLIHLEVIISNMFRDQDDPTIPCRLTSYKNGKIYGQKKLPYLTSWLTGLLFERINQAIKLGILSDKDIEFNKLEKIALEQYKD